MNKPAHTPGPIHNGQPSLGQPCTCCILLRTGEPLESIHGTQPCGDISRIELCPMHNAAPALLEALKGLLAVYTESTDDDGSSAVLNAHDAIAQAEGRTL